MHILIISNSYPTDYLPLRGLFYRDQAEALANARCKVGVISINPISVKTILEQKKLKLGLVNFTQNEVNTTIYKYTNIPKRPTYCVKKAEQKGKAIADHYIKINGKPDIVHLHNYEGVLLALYFKSKYHIPFVLTEHSSRFMNQTIPKSMEKYAQLAFKESEYNISVSKKFSEVLESKYDSKFHYIPNVVDCSFFKPSEKSRKSEDFTFISAGALDNNKNHSLLLRAFKHFLTSKRKAKLIIVGSGPNRDQLISMAEQLEVNRYITFSGQVNREELKSLYTTSWVYVHPSKKETFGVVLIEAMSCGLPLISTKSGGPESIINSPKLGLLCEHDVENLSLAMQQVYDNFESYDSKLIRQEALDNYSSEAISKQLLSVYKKVITKN